MVTAYATHPRYIEHEMAGRPHPERPERIQAVWQELDTAGLTARLQLITPHMAERDILRLAHSDEHINLLKWIAGQEKMAMIDADTYALPVSYDIAALAADGVVQVVDAVLRGSASNGLAAVRPPGHHATPERPMGFCLFNNIAIGARYARAEFGIERVLIVDYDVHHGNGTQDIFYDDPHVLFISTHQHGRGFYPGTGTLQQMGEGAGHGFNINIPFPGGQGDKNYADAFEQIVWAAARRYQPQLILVSAGFDAHHVDPLAHMQLSLAGYAHLDRELLRMAQELCDGKIVFVMEGGYDLLALSHGVRNIAHALLGDSTVSDPYGLAKQPEQSAAALLDQIKQLHGL